MKDNGFVDWAATSPEASAAQLRAAMATLEFAHKEVARAGAAAKRTWRALGRPGGGAAHEGAIAKAEGRA